ncbi:uncharacterized protein V6R79_012068 [Siganus canaliculatus]
MKWKRAVLSIHPNRLQFFWYDSFTLTCAGNSSTWTFWRKTTTVLPFPETSSCGWGLLQEPSCKVKNAYPLDTGVYWCESEGGRFSNSINITVTDGSVILHSPALPVKTGDKVTLVCSYKMNELSQATSDFSASFFKDGEFIGNAANITFERVKVSDQGFYRCEHPTGAQSLESWLAVTQHEPSAAGPPPSPPPPPPPPLVMEWPGLLCSILLVVLYTIMFIVCISIYIRWAKARAQRTAAASASLTAE